MLPAGRLAEGGTVHEERLGHGGRGVDLDLSRIESLADGGQVRDAVDRADGLHVGGDVREVALVERLLAVRGAVHLHEVAARGVADDADALGIDPVLIGMRAQVAHGGLAVLDERRELDGHGAVFGCGHDETRASERMAHLDELLVVGGGEASAGEVDHGGLPRLRARRHHRHA